MESSGFPHGYYLDQMTPSGVVSDIATVNCHNFTSLFGSTRILPRSTNAIGSNVTGHNKASTSTTASSDLVDIALIASKWKEELDKWYEEDPDMMKSSVFNFSKPLAKDVKEAIEEGKNYLSLNFTGSTISFILNIGPSTTVGNTELTKVRFLAIVLRYLHAAAQRESDPESKGFKSSVLVNRVEFDEKNPLFKYRFLLGEGFHLNHDMFKCEEEQNLFLLGCLLLDFLFCSSNKSERYDSLKTGKTFNEYVKSGTAKHGATLCAAIRHSGVSMSLLNEKLPLLEAKARLFKIHPVGMPSIITRAHRELDALRKKTEAHLKESKI